MNTARLCSVAFLQFIFAGLLGVCAGFAAQAAADDDQASGFSSGVSVGDVTDTGAVFWTRADSPGRVLLQLAPDESFTTLQYESESDALISLDLNVKIELTGLSPNVPYFYRFARADDPDRSSRVGRFRTAPSPTQPAGLRFIFSGDTNFETAPLAVMSLAARENADLFIWFGDTIYGDVPAGGLGAASTLEEYRARYKQIRSDPHARELLARMAALVGWDDHEVRNDYAGLDPALSTAQRDAGYQAFFDCMPIRDQQIAADPFRTYRSFQYGSNIEFFMLDGRQYREESAQGACESNLDPDGFALGFLTRSGGCRDALAADRQMLGEAQFQWLTQSLLTSSAAVKFVVNNVPLSYIGIYPYDRWDGYDRQRRDLLEFIDQNQIEGVVFITTDIHANGYNPDVTTYFRSSGRAYFLPNQVQIPELIVGPMGNHTARQSVFGILGEIAEGAEESSSPFMDLITWAEVDFEHRLKLVNGLAFIETNRVSYVLIDVAPTGKVSFTYRGLPPEETIAAAADSSIQAETFFESDIEPRPASLQVCGCGAPLVLLTCLFLPRRIA